MNIVVTRHNVGRMANMWELKCCICGKYMYNEYNNPWPVSDKLDDFCCNQCNDTVVIPARLKLIVGENNDE